jgi:hypothetical protein
VDLRRLRLIAEPGEPRGELGRGRPAAQVAVCQDGTEQKIILQLLGIARGFTHGSRTLERKNSPDLRSFAGGKRLWEPHACRAA